jgi:hypothetical protein
VREFVGSSKQASKVPLERNLWCFLRLGKEEESSWVALCCASRIAIAWEIMQHRQLATGANQCLMGMSALSRSMVKLSILIEGFKEGNPCRRHVVGGEKQKSSNL